MKNIKSLSMLMLSASAVATINTASADIVHNDDVIITFSQCVGNDCVNGENFGFDTQRLKENNLRIHFDDTSNSASFPSNDWRIVVNDTSNGGGSYFAVEDSTAGRTPFRVDAGAPNDSLRVTNAGNVGIGVANPVVELHVKDGDSPTLRLEQDGSSGFTPQTYDIAANESNFFIRDVTNGSRLFFRAQPGAPADSMFIANDGDVGLGTNAPSNALHIRRTNAAPTRLVIENANASPQNVDFDLLTPGNDWRFRANGTTNQLNIIDNTNGRTPVKIAANAVTDLLQVGVVAANRVDITGSLFINAVDNSTPDYVFEPQYDLKAIEEHAEEMWANKSLPFVGAGIVGEDGKAVIDFVSRSQGVLEELEIAHIYIEQLNNALKQKNDEISSLDNRLEAIEKAMGSMR